MNNKIGTVSCMERPPKLNIVGVCSECFNYVCIMKNKDTGTLHCRCIECLCEFQTLEEAQMFAEGKILPFNIGNENSDTFATEEDIKRMGWDKPQNKVCLCHECALEASNNNICKHASGWVVIKKNMQNNELFCRCEKCGSVWLSIEDALGLNSLETTKTLEERIVRADKVIIENFTDPTENEIKKYGWEKYKDIWCIEK